MLDLGVKLAAEQDHDGGDPHPHHHADGGSKRPIGCIVCAEMADVPGEESRGDQPSDGCSPAPDRKPLPARFGAAWSTAPAGKMPAASERWESIVEASAINP